MSLQVQTRLSHPSLKPEHAHQEPLSHNSCRGDSAKGLSKTLRSVHVKKTA